MHRVILFIAENLRIIRAVIRLVVVILWFAFLFLFFVFSKITNLNIKNDIPRFFHKGFLRILNISVNLHGSLESSKPGLLIANHASWLDISILSSIGNVCFIAKSEIAKWPIIGFLAKLQETVFIERKIIRAEKHKTQILDSISKGKKLVLFPEGTSSDGNRVLTFKSSLFSIAETKQGKLGNYEFQAVSICYSEINGLPLSRSQRPNVAWWGNMSLFSHLWNVFKTTNIKIIVTAHKPIISVYDRKIMSKIAWKQVASGMGDALSGRPIPIDTKELTNNYNF